MGQKWVARMKIHALCVVKNEIDIIEQGLAAALPWADAIYVLDNGSSDGSWEAVRRLADEEPKVVAWKQDPSPFSDGLRRKIFLEFADQATRGDWWARLDADEFYIDDPRQFLSNVPSADGCVWYASLSYYFSSEEAERYRDNPAQFADDVPVLERCRHYFNHWSEPRFMRHEVMTPWEADTGWPEGIDNQIRHHPRRIRCRHFAYRSPSQIERRLATRIGSATPSGAFSHEALQNWSDMVNPVAVRKHRWKQITYINDRAKLDSSWESRVVDARALVFDAHDGHFEFNEDLMPPIPNTLRPWWERVRYNRFTRRIAPRRTVAN